MVSAARPRANPPSTHPVIRTTGAGQAPVIVCEGQGGRSREQKVSRCRPVKRDQAASSTRRYNNGEGGRRRVAKRTYSDEEKASAMAALAANGGNAKRTSSQVGVPRT